MVNKARNIIPILIIVIISLFANDIDLTSITAIYTTTNNIIIFGLIPLMMLLISFSNDISNLIIIRKGRRKTYYNILTDYGVSFMLFLVYFGSIIISSGFKINIFSFFLYFAHIVIAYLTIFNITFLLSEKKQFKYFSIFYGIFLSSIFIYFSYIYITIFIYIFLSCLLTICLIISIILLKIYI